MKRKVSELDHHPFNQEIYSLSNIDDLIRSISDVGLLQPLVINQRSQVISGNRRLEAVKSLGWDEVEVDVIETDGDDDEKSLLVHFNKQRVKSYREILNEAYTLKPIYSVGQGKRNDLTSVCSNKSFGRDALAEAIGVSESKLARLMFIDKEDSEYISLIDEGKLTVHQSYSHLSRMKKEKKKIDAIKDKSRESTSRSDDLLFYNKSSHQMVEVDEYSVDLIFTSPPYWNKRLYDGSSLGNETDPEDYVRRLVAHLEDCKRVLKDSGSFFLNLGDTYLDRNLQNIPHRVVIKLQESGWILRNTIIWHKTNPKPSSTKNSLTPTYEFIFHLVKSADYKYAHTLVPTVTETNFKIPRHREVSDKSRVITNAYPVMPREGKNMGDWWDESLIHSAVARNISLPNDKEHPAPFPEEICVLPILQTTDERDVVLDPFFGKGTVADVALALNRRVIGYDVVDYRNQ